MKCLQVIALIILISYSSIEAAKSYNPTMINCYIRHLKNANELGDDIQELENGNSETNCDEIINNMKTQLIRETIKNIHKRLNISNKKQCVGDNLKENKILNKTFKVVVYEVLQESTGKNYENEVREANDKLENVIEDSATYCLFKEDFGELFDELFTDSSEEDDLEADYCARKHVLDNNLLDTSVYTLKVNPNNINTENVNCVEKLKEVIKKIEDDLAEGMKKDEPEMANKNLECRLNAFRGDNTYDKMIATFFFSEINMTEEQKEIEKKKFIIFMGKLAFKAAECEE